MVDKVFILKSIEEAITIKCPTSSKARKRGVGAEISVISDDYGDELQQYEYPDGTIISFSAEKGLYNVVLDGKVYDFPGKKSVDYEYEMFQYMKNQLEGMEGILGNSTMYNFVRQYFDDFATWLGMDINRAMRKDIPLDEVDGIHNWFDVILDGHDTVVELEKTVRIDNEDYATMRVQSNLNHGNDDIKKLVVSDKAHTCTTVGGDWEEQVSTFGSRSDGTPWKIITLIDKESGATGLFAGNPLIDERGRDWEAEVQFAPKQKFERVFIDEENRFIIQKPVIKNK